MAEQSVKIDISLEQQTLNSFERLNTLLDSADKKTKELKNSTIALEKARASGGDTEKKLLRFQKAQASIVKLEKDITLEKEKQANIEKQEKFEEKEAKKVVALGKTKNAYVGLNKAMRKATDDYQHLLTLQAKGAQLTPQQIKQIDALKLEVTELGTAYNKVQTAMANTTGAKQGKRAFDSLGFSVAQITRESPAFLISMNTGLMAISNNIPIFVDELDRLKIKNLELIEAQQQGLRMNEKVVPAWKKVAGAVFSVQSAISLGIVALTALLPMFVKWIKSMDKTLQSQKRLKERQDDVNKSISDQTTKLPLLITAIGKFNGLEEDRLALIQELQDEYPDFNAQILIERDNIAAVNIELEKYVKLSQLRAESAADMARLTEIGTAKQNAQDVISSMTPDEIRKATIADQFRADATGSVVNLTEKQKEYIDAVRTLNELSEEEAGLQEDYIDRVNQINGLKDIQKEDRKEEKEYQVGTIKFLEELIAANEEWIEENVTAEDTTMSKILNDVNDGYREQIKLIRGVTEERDKEDPVENINAQKVGLYGSGGLIEAQEEVVKQLEEMAKLQDDMVQKDLFLKMAAGARAYLKELKTPANASFDPDGVGLPSVLPGGETKDPTFAQKANTKLDAYEEEIALGIDFGNQMLELGDAVLERKLENINAEIEATEDKYDRLYELAEGDAYAQEQITRRKLEDLKVLEAEELKIRQKQAKLRKVQAVSNILISTAEALIRAYADGGPFLGSAFGVLIAALGAASVATVLAQPIPQYAKGREGGREELAIVGDGGRREVIMNKDGSAYLTPNKPTLAMLEKGANVYKNENTYRDSILRTIQSDLGLDPQSIEDAITKGFEKAKVNNYVKMPPIKIDMDHQMWLMKNSNF